jgi:hypothetical protein
MSGVNFSLDAAKRIVAATKKVERTPQHVGGERNPAREAGGPFWAMLTSAAGLNGLHWSWVKVIPVDEPPTADDPYTYDDTPLFRFDDGPVVGIESAREANRNRAIEPGTVVLLSFTGYDRTGEPLYVFQHSGRQPDAALPIHDHRDNFNGGFAFSVYHPGTALPQQPWAV